MRFFKLFKWYEFVYFAVSCAILITLSIIFHSSWLILINALLGILTLFLLSKAIVWGNIVGIVQLVFYIYISVKNSYYGEVISCIIITLPIYIATFIAWLKNKDKGQVKINSNFNYKEFAIMITTIFALSFGFYYMLHAFNTSFLIISTICLSLACIKGYLQIRRSELNFIFGLISNIITFTLWLHIVLQGKLGYIPTVATYAIYFSLQVFGLIRWLQLKKKQKFEEKKPKPDF